MNDIKKVVLIIASKPRYKQILEDMLTSTRPISFIFNNFEYHYYEEYTINIITKNKYKEHYCYMQIFDVWYIKH